MKRASNSEVYWTGSVLRPGEVDAQGNTITVEAISRAYWAWQAKTGGAYVHDPMSPEHPYGRMTERRIMGSDGSLLAAFTYTCRKCKNKGLLWWRLFTPGYWWHRRCCQTRKLIKGMRAGKYTGYSIFGKGPVKEVDDE